MTADIEITRSGELMVSQAEGQSDAGVEYIDAYIPARPGAEYTVVDSGRIILAEQDVPELAAEAARRGLSVETSDAVY